MTEFNQTHGWLQLAFVNEKDTYFLPGLARVDLDMYLLYCLKKSGFQAVVFWDGLQDGEWTIRFKDQDSIRYCESQNLISCIRSKAFWQAPQIPGLEERASIKLGREERVLSWADVAVVVPVEVFSQFYAAASSVAHGDKAMVLLKVRLQEEKDLRCLTNHKTVLPRIDGLLKTATVPVAGKNLYQQLRIHMGRRCHFLCELTKEAVLDMLNQMCVLENYAPELDRASREMAAIVFAFYYRNRKFREAMAASEDMELVLPENRYCERSRMEEILRNPQELKKVLSWLRRNAGDIPQERTDALWERLEKAWQGSDRDGYPCCPRTAVLEQWYRLTGTGNVEDRGLREKLEDVVLWGVEPKWKECAIRCMDEMRQEGFGLEAGRGGLNFLLEKAALPQADWAAAWGKFLELFETCAEERELNGKLASGHSDEMEAANIRVQLNNKIKPRLRQLKSDLNAYLPRELEIAEEETLQGIAGWDIDFSGL